MDHKTGQLKAEQDKGLRWEIESVEHLVEDKWIDFRRVAYRLPDQTVYEPFYSYSRRNYVVIVASDEDGNLICVRQFRHGIGEVTTEFPAGGIETGSGIEHHTDGIIEDTLEAAKRELREETGYESDQWEHLLTIPSNATMADNYAYLYRAKNCRRVCDLQLDETEFLIRELKTPVEIEKLIQEGQFQQAMHILAWSLSKERDRQ
ncbi:MAG: NUDIX hydrolase [Lachnospiraceae bacterium]|nr:NUDIX hydrolase [Lachnospiraceae bacterium]MDY5741875.1 NUDIX hydrolase [Lachnospiraceae bacterium]